MAAALVVRNADFVFDSGIRGFDRAGSHTETQVVAGIAINPDTEGELRRTSFDLNGADIAAQVVCADVFAVEEKPVWKIVASVIVAPAAPAVCYDECSLRGASVRGLELNKVVIADYGHCVSAFGCEGRQHTVIAGFGRAVVAVVHLPVACFAGEGHQSTASAAFLAVVVEVSFYLFQFVGGGCGHKYETVEPVGHCPVVLVVTARPVV